MEKYNLCKGASGFNNDEMKRGRGVDVWVLKFGGLRFLSRSEMDRKFLILIGCDPLLRRRMWKYFVSLLQEVDPQSILCR